MDTFNRETFETETHSEELDFIYNQDFDDIESAVFNNRDIKHDLKTYFRFARKYFSLSGIVYTVNEAILKFNPINRYTI